MQIPATVTAVPDGADARATLPAAMYSAKLLRVVINGTRGTRAEVYVGTQRQDQTSRGASNTAEYTNPIDVPAGMSVSVVWAGNAANAANCNATFTIER